MLVSKYLRFDQVVLCWIINEQTGSLFDQIDNVLRLICGNGRTTKASTTELIHLQEIGADIFRAVNNNAPAECSIVKTSFHAPDPQRKAVASIIRVFRNVESQATLAGRRAVGEGSGELAAGSPP